MEEEVGQLESISEEETEGPDTSSFTAFLYSLLSSDNSEEKNGNQEEVVDEPPKIVLKENGGKKSLFSRGKNSLKAIYQATRFTGYRNQGNRVDYDAKTEDKDGADFDEHEMKSIDDAKEPVVLLELPGASEPSLLMNEKTRYVLYASLPRIVHGRKWLLLYR